MSSRTRPVPKRRPVVPIVLGVIVLLGIVAVVASRGGSGDGDTNTNTGTGAEGTEATEYGPVTVAGDALPALPNSGTDPAVGKRLPEIRGQALDGSRLDILPDGTPKVIFLLAHWCPHCQREVPLVVDWIEQSGDPQGVGLYAVATSTSPQRPNYPPSAWLRRERWPVPTVADDEDSSVARAFGLTGFPFYVVTDGDGTVLARRSGELTVSQIEQLVALARD